MRALDAGARLGRYVILDRVGSGAMGVVYSAYDPELDRRIALKLLKGGGPEAGKAGQDRTGQEETARARLLREAKAMARLAHPNVIAVHDVGVFDEQVFLAMEFLSGGTLKSWLAQEPRGWRAVLDIFVPAGRGLAAAHAAGLVHRDFKPENVLLDKEGRPRVVDFGLAREAGGSGEGVGGGGHRHDGGAASSAARGPAEATVAHLVSGGSLDKLTRTGALMGTPAYMAPEQFLGQSTDERTDQFSFCVALYEALYGERPFEGDNLITLSFSVTEGQLRPLPRDRDVPAWIRRAVLRGLRSDPAERWPSMAELIAALEDDPAVRRRRRLLAAAGGALVLASVVAAVAVVRHRRQELERRIAAHVEEAARAGAAGRSGAGKLRELRGRAFAAFDAMDRKHGEALWREALGAGPAVDGSWERAVKSYETALVLDPARAAIRSSLADVLSDYVVFVEELRREDRAAALAVQLERHDTDGRRRRALAAPGALTLVVTPASAAVTLGRYERDPVTLRRTLRQASPVAPGTRIELPPGSYRLSLRAPGHAEVQYPFEIHRTESLTIDLALPEASAVPAGFAYVPAGELWFGDADEKMRTEFLDTAPIHRRRTGAFLIALRETTFRDWIAFLDALPAAERARHVPDVSTALRGSLGLHERGGAWQLAFQPSATRYLAKAGEAFAYVGRKQRIRQDWLDFPVAGISPVDAERYLRWLADTGRVPGARFCTEVEWERAARGADGRAYPHGDDLAADDANFDVTYGRVDAAFGPDAVGSHPASQSPFGAEDMTGNVFELARSSESADGFVIRGGAYIFGAATCRITNRNVVPSTFRDVTTGIRVCASVKGGP